MDQHTGPGAKAVTSGIGSGRETDHLAGLCRATNAATKWVANLNGYSYRACPVENNQFRQKISRLSPGNNRAGDIENDRSYRYTELSRDRQSGSCRIRSPACAQALHIPSGMTSARQLSETCPVYNRVERHLNSNRWFQIVEEFKMPRAKDSLQHALIKRVLPQIQNNKTGAAYKKHIKNFAKWAKDRGHKRPEDITRDVIQEYEQFLESSPKGYSPATVHTYLAPICAAAGVRMSEIRKPKRTAGSITRGRDIDANGEPTNNNPQGRRQENDPKYNRLVRLQKSVGIRRAELARLKGCDLLQKKSGYFIRVNRGKGGKYQEQYILPEDVPTVKSVFAGVGEDENVFSKEELNNKINLHGLRAEHGQKCYSHYEDLFKRHPEYRDTYRKTLLRRWEKAHLRLKSDDPGAWEHQRSRFVADMDDRVYTLRGDNSSKALVGGFPTEYDRLALMCVSVLHLSHWRLDVTVTNYLIS